MPYLDIGVPKTDTFNAKNGQGGIKNGQSVQTYKPYKPYKGVQGCTKKRTQSVQIRTKAYTIRTKAYKSVQNRTKPYTVIRPCTVVRLYGFLGRAESGVVIQWLIVYCKIIEKKYREILDKGGSDVLYLRWNSNLSNYSKATIVTLLCSRNNLKHNQLWVLLTAISSRVFLHLNLI